MTRVLFISAEPLGPSMAGPAIRVLELARAVAAHCEVTMAAPGPSDAGDAPVEVIEARLEDFNVLLEAVKRHDVVVAQRLPPQLLRYVAQMPMRFVADLYNPQMIEVLEAAERRPEHVAAARLAVDAGAVLGGRPRDLRQREATRPLAGRDGAGGTDRRRALPRRPDLPRLRGRGAVRAAGPPPAPSGPVLKGVWPGIEAEDRVLLWAGGMWRWLDAITPIRAVEQLRAGGRRVHLVFLGTGPAAAPGLGHPDERRRRDRLRGRAGARGQCVHFNRGWIPYAERGAYLLDSDIGVCAHHEHLEARFSFRTRVLDHFWAGLPSVVSGGDAIGDLVDRRGLGAAVAPDDVDGFACACARLLDTREAYHDAATRVEELAPSLRWTEVAQPLVRFCRELGERDPREPARGPLARATYGQYPDILADLRERGGIGRGRQAGAPSRGARAAPPQPRARSGTRPAWARASRPRASC